MASTHAPNITVNVTLDAAPRQEAGFGYVLLIAKKATSGLGGDSIRTYTDAADAAADDTAGELSTAAYEAVAVALSQSPRPAGIKVAWIDLVGTETYSAALARIRAIDDDFYGVAIEERTDAAILAIAAAVEATGSKICAVQTDEAGFYTGTYPAALTALAVYERTAIVLHDEDTEWADVAWLANRLTYDPDVISAPWSCPIQGVAANTDAPTAAERAYAIGHNANVLLPYGGAPLFVDAGVMASGRPVYEVVSADWFRVRLEEAIAALMVNAAARGAKIPVSTVGSALILAELKGLLERGVTAGHFIDYDVAAVAITDADTDAQRLRFTGRAVLAVGARIFTFNLNFSRSALD